MFECSRFANSTAHIEYLQICIVWIADSAASYQAVRAFTSVTIYGPSTLRKRAAAGRLSAYKRHTWASWAVQSGVTQHELMLLERANR